MRIGQPRYVVMAPLVAGDFTRLHYYARKFRIPVNRLHSTAYHAEDVEHAIMIAELISLAGKWPGVYEMWSIPFTRQLGGETLSRYEMRLKGVANKVG